MKLNSPFLVISLRFDVENHKLLRDDAVDDAESRFGPILEQRVNRLATLVLLRKFEDFELAGIWISELGELAG